MMRRSELQDYERMQQPPFRVLSPGARIPYEPQALPRSPPSSRAPEPYKLAPQASNYARTQRKSSFAIIAEAREASPSEPVDPGQLPASGRLSPFRGRGFKGPPPRSRSRPRTPPSRSENTRRKTPSGFDRTTSTSQQNSPKRSQIPRPARSRSISSGKENESRKASPKFGRRAVNRYTTSISNNDANNRRSPQKDTKTRQQMSPIKGTPTKASADKNNSVSSKGPAKNVRAQRTTKSPEKTNRNLLVQPKNVPDNKGKRFVSGQVSTPREKTSIASTPDSPSKIPLRKGPYASNSNLSSNLEKSPSAKPTAATSKDKSANPQQAQPHVANGNDRNKETFKVISGNKNSSSPKDGVQSTPEDDLKLVDFLKYSSGATGTSSVVNTTTTTAVQPLHIDAASILAESELVAKLTSLERKQKNAELKEKSTDGQKSSGLSKSQENNDKIQTGGQSEQPPTSSGGTNIQEDKTSSGTNVKSGNPTQTMIKQFGPNPTKGEKISNNNSSGSSALGQGKVKESLPSSSATDNEKSKDEPRNSAMDEQEKQRQASTSLSNQKKADGKSSGVKSTNKLSDSANDSKNISPSSRVNSATDALVNSEEVKNNASRAKKSNGISLDSQTEAVSSESLGSLRSTDTGVSVNTVRGVSSAKEKTGLHFVKRPEEIETLSGNIVHLDRNGEHAVASDAGGGEGAAAAAADTLVERTRWQRWKNRWRKRFARGKGRKVKEARAAKEEGTKTRSNNTCRSCWSKMRCLACRREPKGQLWPGKQARAASTMQLAPGSRDDRPSRWARLKDACRCGWRHRRRAQQRAAAAAVASSPSTGCCRSLFSRCNCSSWTCRRRDSEQSRRSKSVRAKHSLSSVAAPPLSEETKAKLPDVLVEHNSVMRGAIPCLPLPVAWFCLIWNVLVPGSGTIFSGLFNICMGQPRFSAVASLKARFGALIVDIIVGVSQLFTVLFCLVGWGWSIWWGVTMVRLAKKYKRFKDSEAAANDPEARSAPENATLPTPGIPAQVFRATDRPQR